VQPNVPPPVAPGEAEAWYAPDVRAQYAVASRVVATVREDEDGFVYEPRLPTLGPVADAAFRRVDDRLGAEIDRPRTREGIRERAADPPADLRAALDREGLTPAARRRVRHHALAATHGAGMLTAVALDDRVDTVDGSGDRLVVHHESFAPARTRLPAAEASIERFAGERLARYEVSFAGYDVPVELYRTNALGGDHFAVRYAIREPALMPADRDLVEACKERVWAVGSGDEGAVEDRVEFVRERAERLVRRRLTARAVASPVASARRRIRAALAEFDLAPPPRGRAPTDRVDDLVYHVLRDLVGHGALTIPIRDPNLEDIEANRVDERVKVVPRDDLHDGRVPTNVSFDDETEFVNLVTRLAAADGEELSASRPSAKVNLDAGTGETIRCAVALPTISEGGPHVSIRKQAADPMTPADLIERDALSTELAALLWLQYEHRGVVLFAGPTGVGKTTLMNAHMPFVPFSDRPISIDEGSREVRLPHETGVSLTTREHEREYKRVSMAQLMTEANYLNPDLEVIAEVNTPASFETFGESLNTGHGVIGTTHAEDVHKLVNRVVEQGLPAYLLREIDLVVFPRRTDGERYVGEVVELLTDREHERLAAGDPDDARGTIRKDGTAVHWNRVAVRGEDGAFAHAFDPEADGERARTAVFARLADRTDRPVSEVRAEFRRKHRYVRYLVEEGVTDFGALFAFLADLRTDEAATVERAAADAPVPEPPDLDEIGEVARGDD
jgi:type IV secretory pathway ATPase VirB11/archaellum biosynthesis ATPase